MSSMSDKLCVKARSSTFIHHVMYVIESKIFFVIQKGREKCVTAYNNLQVGRGHSQTLKWG